jgi:predicted DNA-binding transcriptional regulator AlpA
VSVRGRRYASQKAAAHALGVSRQRIQQILKRDRERALGLVAKDGRPPKPVRIGGREYASRTEAARALGVGIDTVVRWSKRGGAPRPLRLIIMDLETFEQSVSEGFRGPVTEARGILMQQADVLEALEIAAEPTAAIRPRRSTAAKRSLRAAKT